MKLKNVLLDAGGVILDESEQETMNAEIIISLIRHYRPAYTIQDYCNDVESAVKIYCTHIYQSVIWKNVKPNLEKYIEIKNEFKTLHRQKSLPLKLNKGIKEQMLKMSQKLRIVIAGQYGKSIINLLDEEGILKYLHSRITQDDFAITKPDPRYYAQILEKVDFKAENSVMVGDRIDKDIIPAKQVGMKTILFRTGLHRNQQARIPEELPDKEIMKITELCDTIHELDPFE